MFNFNTHKVNFDDEIGEGGQGTIYAYQPKHSGDDKYVVKRIMTPQIDTMLSTVQEIVLGFSCDNPHVLPIKGYHLSYDKSKKFWDIFIKIPRMETSLKTRIDEYAREKKVFKEEEIAKYFYSLILGLKYLHNRHIAHRDIKPDNILIDKQGNLKIADVGIAKMIEDESTEHLTRAFGTPLYTAPEIFTHASELKKRDLFLADIWSLGVTMAELCVPKTRLINTKTTGKANESMLDGILRGLQDRYSKKLLELILSLLRTDPSERKSLEEVQRILEETYPNILAQYNKIKEHKVQDEVQQENEDLKSKLLDLHKQIQDLQSQLETSRLLYLKNDNKSLEEEKRSEEIEPNKNSLKGNCLKIIEGHTDWVNCLAVATPDILASASNNNFIKLWNLATGTCLKTLQGHTGVIQALEVLSLNELVSCSHDKTIKIWNIKTGTCLQTLEGHTNEVLCLELLPGDLLASGSYGTLKIWDIQRYSCVGTLGEDEKDWIYCLKYLPVKNQLASGYGKTIKFWDINKGTCLKTLQGHKGEVRCLLMLPSGELASGSEDNTIKLWNLNTGTCLKTLEGHTDIVKRFELLPSGELVSGSNDGTIKVWNIKTGNYMKNIQAHKNPITSLKVLPTGQLATGSHDKTIRLWE